MPRFNPLKPTREAKKGRPSLGSYGPASRRALSAVASERRRMAIRGDRTIPAPSPVSHTAILAENDALDGFELRFPTKPSDACLARLRATHDLPTEQRWHWHFRKKFWYAKRNDVTRAFAASILAAPSAVAPAKAEAPAAEPMPDPLAAPEPSEGGFPVAHWAHAVQSGATSLSYTEWVEARIADASDDAPAPAEDKAPDPAVELPATAKVVDPLMLQWAAAVKAGITGLAFGDWTVQKMSEASGDSPAMVGRFIDAAAGNAAGAAIIQVPQPQPEPVADPAETFRHYLAGGPTEEEPPTNILPVSFAPEPPLEAVPVVPSACRAVALAGPELSSEGRSERRPVPAWRARFGRRP